MTTTNNCPLGPKTWSLVSKFKTYYEDQDSKVVPVRGLLDDPCHGVGSVRSEEKQFEKVMVTFIEKQVHRKKLVCLAKIYLN